jgi:hypothetical protein
MGRALHEMSGGNLGFGMIHTKRDRYDLQEEEERIKREKAESKKKRETDRSTKGIEQTNKVLNQANIQEEKDKKVAIEVFVNGLSEEEKGKYQSGTVESVVTKEKEKEINEEAEKEISEEKLASITRQYNEDDKGKKLNLNLVTAEGELEKAKQAIEQDFQGEMSKGAESNFIKNLNENELTGLKEKMSTDERSIMKAEVEKNKSYNKQKKEGEAAKPVSEEEVLRSLLQTNVIPLGLDSGLSKDLLEKYKTGGGANEDRLKYLGAATTSVVEAKAAVVRGRDEAKVTAKYIQRAEKDVVGEDGSGNLENRVAKKKQFLVEAENKKKQEAAEEAFLESESGKGFIKQSEERRLEIADAIASGQTRKLRKMGIESPEIMSQSAKSRSSLAEEIRYGVKKTVVETKVKEAEKAEKERKQTILGSAFGERQETLQLVAEQASAAAAAFADVFKNEELSKKMKEATDLIEKKMKVGAKDAGELIEKAYKKNVFARAFEQQEVLGRTKELTTMNQTRLSEMARTYKVEKPFQGRATPSTSLVPLAERLSKNLVSLEATDSADFAAGQIAHLLLQRKKTGKIDEHQHAYLFGTAQHLGKNGWFDDTFSRMAGMFDDLDSGKITDSGEREEIRNLKDVFVNQLKLVGQDETTGKYLSLSSPDKVATLQNLMISGGDVDLIKDQQKGNAIDAKIKASGFAYLQNDEGEYLDNKGEIIKGAVTKDANGKVTKVDETKIAGSGVKFTKGVNDSYQDIMGTLAKASQLSSKIGGLSVKTFEQFDQKMGEIQEYLQEASSFFKRNAFSVGHQEYGAHQQFDDKSKKFRFVFNSQAEGLMQAEARKFSGKLKWQYHGLGEANVSDNKLTKVIASYWRSQMQELTTALSARAVPERTQDAATGSAFSSERIMKNGQAVLGTNFADPNQFIKDVLLNEIEGGAEAIKYIARQRWDHVATAESDRGIAKLQVEGTNIQGDMFSDFLKSTLEYVTKNQKAVEATENQIAALKRAISQAVAKEASSARAGKGVRNNQASDSASDEETTMQDDESAASV